MQAIGAPLNLLFGALGAVLKPFGSSKPATQPAPLPMATRDDAAAAAQQADELRRRRGGAADIVAGSMGAGGPGKATLGS